MKYSNVEALISECDKKCFGEREAGKDPCEKCEFAKQGHHYYIKQLIAKYQAAINLELEAQEINNIELIKLNIQLLRQIEILKAERKKFQSINMQMLNDVVVRGAALDRLVIEIKGQIKGRKNIIAKTTDDRVIHRAETEIGCLEYIKEFIGEV